MNEEWTGKCLRQVEHIRGHLWHRYSTPFNQERKSPEFTDFVSFFLNTRFIGSPFNEQWAAIHSFVVDISE